MTDKLLDELKLALGSAYTIERELTGGGMSRVFVAKEHALGREVVIKVLPPDLAAGVNRERFRREVQLAASLSHPYIVPLLSAGEHGELLWFTMPYIPGDSLRTRLQRTGPLSLAETVRMLHDVVEALAYAHSRGVIHRDIKPGNILSDGQHAVVTDFGVAKALNAALPGGPGHTTSGMVIGTPAYMAPEQLAADPAADQRVDIYAVGLLAYELLTGASPFNEKSPTATMTAQLTRIPPPLHLARPEIPTAFSDLIQRCLAKSPEERPADARAVLAELDRISGALAAEQHRGGDALPRAHASSVPLILALLGVVSLVVAGVVFTQQSRKPTPVKPDTIIINAGGDVGEKPLKLPAKPMTHGDSLKIAEALRDELEQLDSSAPKPGAAVAATPATPLVAAPSLDAQVHQTDSIVRARLAELATRRPSGGFAPPTYPATPGSRGTSGATRFATGPDSTTRRVMVLATHGRNTVADSTELALEQAVVNELTNRLRYFGQWHVLTRDSLRGTPTSGAPFDAADIAVIMAFHHNGTDSVDLQIELRNMQAQSSFGFRVLTSPMVYKPTSVDPFRSTIRDASRVLEDLRRLPPGQPWPADQGRGRGNANRGSGGPYDPPSRDSMHVIRRPPGRSGRDSM